MGADATATNAAPKNGLMAKLLAITVANTVKGRGASGKHTYLDRFVSILLDENGKPTPGKSRSEIIAIMSYDIAVEQRQADQVEDKELKDFDLDSPADLAIFAEINNKVKNQVAAAVSDSNNATALSYNALYKDVWTVVKDGQLVSLKAKEAKATKEAPAAETAK